MKDSNQVLRDLLEYNAATLRAQGDIEDAEISALAALIVVSCGGDPKPGITESRIRNRARRMVTPIEA